MKLHPSEFFLLFVVVFLAALGALIAWTLIVKNQVSAQIAAGSANNPVLSLISNL